jgi:multiple sugar transport system substrate-binding protein
MRHMSPRARGLAVASTAAAAALALTACAGGGTSGGSSENVTLSYAIWDQNQQPAMQKIADAFHKQHPNVTVKIQLTPNKEYWTKLQTAVSGGSGPDVFWMNGPHIQLYASNGVLAPLDDQKIDTANYPKSLVDLYTYDGKLYGAPKDFDTIGVWYNKALFDAAGVPYPKAGWTWDDMKADAAKLTDKAKGVYGIAASQYSQENYYDSIPQAGGYVISPDHKKTGYGSPEALKGIEFWLDFIKAGTSPTAQQMTDTAPEDLFNSGKVAMLQTGSWAAIGYAQNADIADKVNVAPLPMGPAGNQSVIHGLANVANAKSPHADVAKEFAAFASGKEASQIQADTGTVIPAYNGTQNAWVTSMPKYDLHYYIDAVKDAVPYPVSKNTAVWAQDETDILSQVWAGTLAPEAGMKQLADKMQTALDAEQKK